VDILLNSGMLIVGFIILIKASDIFVDGSVAIASKLGVPAIVIGLTIVSIGTSAPELVTSIVASIQGSSALAIGNAVGSNIVNLLLIVGLCAFIMPFYMNVDKLFKDFYISILAAIVLLGIIFFNQSYIPRVGALILAIGFIIYIVQLVKTTPKDDYVDEELESKGNDQSYLKLFGILVASIIALVIGSQLIVASATFFAQTFGISARVIGLTVVALGTSLPELSVSLTAFKKQENDIAMGNIIGSNIFNILFVLGIAGSITPLETGGPFNIESLNAFIHTPLFDLVFLIIISLIVLVFLKVSSGLSRLQAGVMLVLYIAYTSMLILL